MLFSDVVACAALAALVAGLLLSIRWRDVLGTDEAYLWYGVLRLREGLLPHRDFRSYEPGRYVWCAAWAVPFGRGLAVVRAATHGFYAIGLTAALMGLRSLGFGWIEVALTAVLLASWAHPQHKLFEPALLMFGFASSVWLLTAAVPAAALVAGATIGGALFFGFNYFLYLGAAHALVWVVAFVTPLGPLPWNLLTAVACGALLGVAPFLVLLLVPGFAVAFFDRRVRSILRRGSSNLPLPIPWPWCEPPPQLAGLGRVRQRALQWLFLALPVAPLAALLAALAIAPPAHGAWVGVVAAAALGATGWHHAFSRADPPHLAQSMAPLLLLAAAASALAPALQVWSLLALVAASLATTWWMHPLVQRRVAPAQFSTLLANGFRIWAPTAQCRLVACAEELSRQELRDGGTLVALPTLVALYPILDRPSPIYDTFSVFPASEAEQARMVESMKRSDVRLAFISNGALDGREALRFSATHPRVWAYVNATMQPVAGLELPADVHVFRRPAAASLGDSAPGR